MVDHYLGVCADDPVGHRVLDRLPDAAFLPLQDDISSVAYWYQTHPGKPFPKLPSREYLEII